VQCTLYTTHVKATLLKRYTLAHYSSSAVTHLASWTVHPFWE